MKRLEALGLDGIDVAIIAVLGVLLGFSFAGVWSYINDGLPPEGTLWFRDQRLFAEPHFARDYEYLRSWEAVHEGYLHLYRRREG